MADNATRLKILASVEGIQGFDGLKRSLQGLAQQGAGTGRDLIKLRAAYEGLRSSGDQSIAGMRAQMQVLTQLRETVNTNSIAFRRYGAELDQVRSKLKAVSGAEQGAAAGAGAGGGLLAIGGRLAGPLAALYAAQRIGQGIIEPTAQYETQARSLQVLTGSAQQALQIIQQLQDLGAVTPFTSSELIDAAKRLQAFGIETSKVVDITSRLADVSGATGAELSGLVTAYGQVQAKGRLQGEELLQFQERGVDLAGALRRAYGMSSQEFQDALEKGRIGAKSVEYALIGLTSAGGKYANGAIAQSDTLAGKFSTLNDGIAKVARTIGTALTPAIKTTLDVAILAVDKIGELIGSQQAASLGSALQQSAFQLGGSLIPTIPGGALASPLMQGLEQQFPGLLQGAIKSMPGARAAMDLMNPPPPPPPDGKKYIPPPTKGQLAGGNLPPLLDGRLAGKPSAESLILKKPYGAQIIAAARKRGLDPALLAGLVQAESGFNQSAISSAGAIGLGQLMPETARGLGVNPRDALQNLAGAAEYLAKQIAEFGLEGGLRAYNQGPGNQRRFPAGVSAEARLYPGKVLAAAKGFGYEDAGGIKAAELQVSALDQRKRDAQKLAEKQQQQTESTTKQNQKINDQLTEREIAEANSLNTAQQQLAAMQNTTEVMRARLEYAHQLQQIESDLAAKKADPMMSEGALKSAEALAEVKKEEAKLTLADAERKAFYDQLSTQWQDQQVTLAATLSDYYSQQSEQLQEQNQYAESLAQTIGQGMQQAFSLAIQGAENLGESLRQLGATVLKDIAQQLIQIAVIAPVVNAIGNIGRRSPFTPISPGINALPGGDFSQFFPVQGVGSFAAGLPTAGITPFQGGNPFSFATGGIMTPQGPVPLRTYARGGIATAPQAAIYGEGSTPEAFIPLPDGRRVPVALKQYPGIPGASSAAQFESTDQVVQRLVETARQESTARAAAVAASSPDGTVRIKVETTRINSVDYVTAEQAEALAQAAATRSTARQQRALQSSPGARRSLGI